MTSFIAMRSVWRGRTKPPTGPSVVGDPAPAYVANDVTVQFGGDTRLAGVQVFLGELCFSEGDPHRLRGEAGDVVLLHPYTLHATSQNVLGVSRIITNPALALREPMNFNRPKADDFSLVVQAVLRGLGADRLDFVPTAPRKSLVPERVRRRRPRAGTSRKAPMRFTPGVPSPTSSMPPG
jgi:hypothetical protein